MNNGQPPYGDPNAWGQQGSQVNPAQYPAQQNPYGQQGYYGQQGATWQPEASQPGAQPYAQQQQFNQPYAGQQSYSQSFQPVETYQQQPRPQQQVYQQQSWQPYGYTAQQPQQMGYTPAQPGPQPQPFYGQNQNAAPQQPAYPQFNQMGQQVQQGYGGGYSGYSVQPQEKKAFELPLELVAKVVLFGVLPVLFILAMIFAVPALKWLFLAGAVAGIILMWMKDVVSPNLRFTLSLVYGVMAVIALVGALNGAPADQQNVPGNQHQQGQQVQQGVVNVQTSTATPTMQPTATPAPESNVSQMQEQLMSFFYHWSLNNYDAMLDLTAPSWRVTVDDPARALFVLLLNRTPMGDHVVSKVSGTDNDVLRTATVTVTINKNDGRATNDRYSFKVVMKKEDDIWYVDPQSLASNEKETATETVSSANNTPTQPPLYTGTPSTILYYNANGGSMYHLDPDCPSVGKKYKPMSQFMFTQLGQAPYNALRPCNQCGAPIPDDD